jgi:hypothetical protein
MSYDCYERAYHLTPNGWVSGELHYYGTVDKKEPAPKDKVLTLVKSVEQSSGYQPETVAWRQHYRSRDAKRVARLLKKFGNRPPNSE